MSSPHMQIFCVALAAARDAGRMKCAKELSRELFSAVYEDAAAAPGYDPSADRRVEWALALIRQKMNCVHRPRASAELEFLVGEMIHGRALVPLTGKDLSAGERRSA